MIPSLPPLHCTHALSCGPSSSCSSSGLSCPALLLLVAEDAEADIRVSSEGAKMAANDSDFLGRRGFTVEEVEAEEDEEAVDF